MTSFKPRASLLVLLLSLLSACDKPIDLVDPYDRIQGEPSGQVSTPLDVPAHEPEPTTVAQGSESGGAGGAAPTNGAAQGGH